MSKERRALHSVFLRISTCGVYGEFAVSLESLEFVERMESGLSQPKDGRRAARGHECGFHSAAFGAQHDYHSSLMSPPLFHLFFGSFGCLHYFLNPMTMFDLSW